MKLAKLVRCFVLNVLLIFCGVSVGLAQQDGTDGAKTLSIGPQSEIRFSAPWTESAVRYSNAQELVVTRQTRLRVEGQVTEQLAEYAVARMLITTEPRSSHTDALNRLGDIAASGAEPAEFVEIGGWPAVKVKFVEPLPRPGEEGSQAPPPEVLVQREIIAIAANDKLLTFDISLMPDAPPSLLQGAEEVARSAHFAKRGDPNEVKQTLERLQGEEAKRKSLHPPVRGEVEDHDAIGQALIGAPRVAAVTVQGGLGELEVAASTNASNVVIASNQALSFSTNFGASFAAASTGVFGLSDPSLARAVSGNFYLGVIAFPTGTPPQLNVTGCTNAVSRSTNGGANFALRGYSARCPLTGAGICFPDQEHIAGDAVNAAGGNDQLYAVWRNFTPSTAVPNCGALAVQGGIATASISCSQDSGTNWTSTAAIPGAGDFPRAAVGADGSVYVVRLISSNNRVVLNRFTSCANGLTAATGFPVTVATLNGQVACPIPGLDRCNNGNTLSSPTVAPDPADANHLFVSFAEMDRTGNELIITLESRDRGLTFPNRRTVSANVFARRFMPWSCSTLGSAWVGWYDRRAATAGASNDLTDYFVGSTGGTELNLTNNPDPQCASGWTLFPPRSARDSESCQGPVGSPSAQPQLAGRCSLSGNRCDFSDGCSPGQGVCNLGLGAPKYGDYNGIACAGDYVIAAWTSATSPAGLTPATGMRIFSSTLFVGPEVDIATIIPVLFAPADIVTIMTEDTPISFEE